MSNSIHKYYGNRDRTPKSHGCVYIKTDPRPKLVFYDAGLGTKFIKY